MMRDLRENERAALNVGPYHHGGFHQVKGSKAAKSSFGYDLFTLIYEPFAAIVKVDQAAA